MESRCIAATEKRERALAEISHLKVLPLKFLPSYCFHWSEFLQMELKHSELQKIRLEENLALVKADRDEMVSFYF